MKTSLFFSTTWTSFEKNDGLTRERDVKLAKQLRILAPGAIFYSKNVRAWSQGEPGGALARKIFIGSPFGQCTHPLPPQTRMHSLE